MKLFSCASVLAAAALLATGASAQQDPPQWDKAASYVGGGLVRGSDGNFYRAIHNSIGHDPAMDDHSFWELYYVRANKTLNIAMSGARFKTVTQAWAFVSSATIAPSVSVVLSISSQGTTFQETFATPLNLNHSSGSQISIKGDSGSQVVLKFPGISGVVISNGHHFGGISDVTLDGVSAAAQTTGILVSLESSLDSSQLEVKNFETNFKATRHGSIIAPSSITLGGKQGYDAEDGSLIDASGSSVTNPVLYCYHAANRSLIKADFASCTGASNTGYFAELESSIHASNSSSVKNVEGYVASDRATIYANGSTSSQNNTGYIAYKSSYIEISGNTVNQNVNNYNITPNQLAPDGSMIQN